MSPYEPEKHHGECVDYAAVVLSENERLRAANTELLDLLAAIVECEKKSTLDDGLCDREEGSFYSNPEQSAELSAALTRAMELVAERDERTGK